MSNRISLINMLCAGAPNGPKKNETDSSTMTSAIPGESYASASQLRDKTNMSPKVHETMIQMPYAVRTLSSLMCCSRTRYVPTPKSRIDEMKKLAAIASAKIPTSSGVSNRAMNTEPINCRPYWPNCWLNDHASDLRVVCFVFNGTGCSLRLLRLCALSMCLRVCETRSVETFP